jgi:hypothetical protein
MSKCSTNEIERDGYSYKNKSGKQVDVKPTCIKDKGKPGKGEKLINFPEEDVGLLSKYGYKLKNSHEKRVESLKKAIKDNSELKILRHVNAIRTLQKSNEKLYNKLDKDMKWLQKDYQNQKGGDDGKKTPSPWSLVNFDKTKQKEDTKNNQDEKKIPSPWSAKNNQDEKKIPSPWSLVNFKKEKKGSK